MALHMSSGGKASTFGHGRKHFLLVFAALFLGVAGNCVAQYNPNVVFWDDSAECGSKRLTTDKSRGPKCSKIEAKGRAIQVIEGQGVKLTVQPIRDTLFVTIRAKIDNETPGNIHPNVPDWRIVHYSSEKDFRDGAAPLSIGEPLKVWTVRRNRTSRSISDPLGSPALQAIDTVKDARDPRTVVILPKSEQRWVPLPQNDHVATSPLPPARPSKPSQVMFKKTTITDKSVSPRKSVSGSIMFSRPEGSAFHLAVIHIGDTTFVFQIR